MAAVTLGVATASTVNGTSYASDAFTPAAGDLLIALVQATATTDADSSLSDSQALGFTEVGRIADRGGGVQAQMVAFVSNAAAAASSMTVTFDCTGDAATGCSIIVLRVSGMSKFGALALAQALVTNTDVADTTPTATFGSAAQTGNPTIGFVGNNNNTANVTEPTGWTEQADIGHSTPTSGIEVVGRDSGFTGTTITWGGTSASAWGVMLLELDASSSGNPTLTAEAGSYTITGTAAALKTARLVTANGASYAIAGTDAALKFAHLIAASAGSFTIAGTDATLTVESSNQFTLVVDPGSYAITGTAAALRVARTIAANGGAYTVNGVAAALEAARVLSASAGSFVITGTDANLDADIELLTTLVEFVVNIDRTLASDVELSRTLLRDVAIDRLLADDVER